MASFLPPLVAELKASTAEFNAKLDEAQAKMAETAEKGQASGGKLAALGGGVVKGLAVGSLAIGAFALDMASKMDTAKSQLESTGDVSDEQAKKISNAFTGMGFQFTVSGDQMMSALAPVSGQLAQLDGHSLTAAESVAIMTNATHLAEASHSDLKTTTANLVNVLQTYGITAMNSSTATDALWNAAKQTGVPVDQVSSALVKMKGRLDDAGMGLTQSAGLLTFFSENGLKGTRAVGGLTTALNSFYAPSKSVSAELNTLGIKTHDAHGQMLPFEDILGQLHTSFAKMPEAQQLATAKQLGFGNATNAMLQLIRGGPAAMDAQTASVTKSGSTAQAAEKATDNLKGTMEKLEAGAKNLGIVLGERLTPYIKDLGHWLQDGAHWLEVHKGAAEALAGVIGGVLAVAVAAFTINKLAQFGRGVLGAINAVRDFTSGIINLASRLAGGIGADAASAQLGAMSAAVGTNTVAVEENTTAEVENEAAVTSNADRLAAQIGALEANTAAHAENAAAIDASVGSMGGAEAAAGGLEGGLAGAGEAAGGLSAGLGGAGLLGVLGPAALGIGLVGGAIYLMSQHSGGAVTNVSDFTKALAAAGNQSGQSAAQIEAVAFANSKAGQSLSGMGIDLGQFTGFLQGSSKQIDDVFAAFQQGAFKGADFDKQLKTMAGDGNTFAQALEGVSSQARGPLLLSLHSAAEATDEKTAADNRQKQALDGVKLSSDQMVQSLQKQITDSQAAQSSTDAMNAALDQAKSDQLDVTQAQNDLNAATQQYGPQSIEAQQASLQLSQAQRQAHGDFQNVSTAILSQIGFLADHDTSVDQFKQHQQDMIQKLKDNQQQLGLTDQQVQDLSNAILKVPPGKDISFSTNAPQVIAAIQGISTAVRNVANSATADLAGFIASHSNSGHALGGALSPGFTPVGEQGTEVVYWDGHGAPFVVSNPSTAGGNFNAVAGGPSRASGGGTAGGQNTTLVLQLDGQQVARLLWPHFQTESLQRGRIGQKLVATTG